ncbi:hypothetical protein BJ878DRAFT_146090 [Calycina marina]|uniref:Uncharacterized protein n=1 Tax=Calycina marina TaxID=1763456 RepID=A0A9P7Z8Z0_9HELO|nr:hypothetical protein BJ878DRAFT_146090 [Calycina marina]
MSAPLGEEPVDNKKGLIRYLARAKILFKKAGSKRVPLLSKPWIGEASAVAGETSTSFTPVEPLVAQPAIEIDHDAVGSQRVAATEGPQPVKILRSQVEAYRERKLGQRFKLPVLPSLLPEKELVRVVKPIRMRIHRTCHKCSTSFGNGRLCVCGHNRCKSCPRYPPKKYKDVKSSAAPVRNDILEVDDCCGLTDTFVLTIPSQTGGQDLVRKKPTQRVRRICHQCETIFQSASKACVECAHRRCVDCPRGPAKKRKYPDGYPGDAPSSNPILPMKYDGHKCNKTYPPVLLAENTAPVSSGR